ncbi:MAG: hypothetical protein QXJ06_01755, partial [Candidatus Aenigmatarchaeota archaeon]
ELFIAVGGVTVPYLFIIGDKILLPVSSTGSTVFLLLSAVIIAVVMIPWCFFMGATYPLMMAFLEIRYNKEKDTFSFLYLANVFGAMAGTFCTALFLVEIFGFQKTLIISACINVIVSIVAIILGICHGNSIINDSTVLDNSLSDRNNKTFLGESFVKPYTAKIILFITGFCSMGMEVIWTRSFTPVLGTLIYSFAALLFIYLFATWAGSCLYRFHLRTDFNVGLSVIILLLAISSFFPIVFTDPRLHLRRSIFLLTIVPFCAILGYLTPRVIDFCSQGNHEIAGKAYAINIAGCVLGPLVASYCLLPFFGSRVSSVFLVLPLIWLVFKVLKGTPFLLRAISLPVIFVLMIFSLLINRNFEEQHKGEFGVIRHDYSATVLSVGDGMNKKLFVNGVGMTSLTPITKDMAHMPLVFLGRKPQSALVICFGMGTTFRSIASWGIEATAVELTPSVIKAFKYYHDDAEDIMRLHNAKIVIDDGRRFLRRNNKLFDVITIDPPPPINAAGSSLLYSIEFYSLAKKRMPPDGILHQWVPGGSNVVLAAITSSLTTVFSYVRMFKSIEGWGYHYIASMRPINVPS